MDWVLWLIGFYLVYELAPAVYGIILVPFVLLMIIALLPALFRLAFNIIALPFELLGKYSDYKIRMLERERQEEREERIKKISAEIRAKEHEIRAKEHEIRAKEHETEYLEYERKYLQAQQDLNSLKKYLEKLKNASKND